MKRLQLAICLAVHQAHLPWFGRSVVLRALFCQMEKGSVQRYRIPSPSRNRYRTDRVTVWTITWYNLWEEKVEYAQWDKKMREKWGSERLVAEIEAEGIGVGGWERTLRRCYVCCHVTHCSFFWGNIYFELSVSFYIFVRIFVKMR